MPDSISDNRPVARGTELAEDATCEEALRAGIRVAAMDMLARREHSLLELRNKLKRRFADERLMEEELCRLAGENLQSDVRFAESYVRQRVGRGYGPLRLRAELRARGISDADAEVVLEAGAVDWSELASAVLRKKFGDNEPRDMKEKARRIRFIQHRGFASDHYRTLLRG